MGGFCLLVKLQVGRVCACSLRSRLVYLGPIHVFPCPPPLAAAPGYNCHHHSPSLCACREGYRRIYVTALYCITGNYSVLHLTALYCITGNCSVLHLTELYCITGNCTALHYTALYCITLHCTALLDTFKTVQPM